MIEIKFEVPMITSIIAEMEMDRKQAKVAEKLFHNVMAVVKDGDGIRFVREKEAKEDALFGPAAVLAYMESLGLSSKPMDGIPVHDILELCDTMDEAHDILFLMNRVKLRNERVKRLKEMNAPEIIMRNEIRMLWEMVEQLYLNQYTFHPSSYTCPDEDGEKVHIRVCVTDLLMRKFTEDEG